MDIELLTEFLYSLRLNVVKIFISLLFLFNCPNLLAFDCKIDKTYLLSAKATGGGVFCKDTKKYNSADPITFYDLSKVRFLAFWKVLGHGSLDNYYYDSSQLPADKVKIELNEFPTNLYQIEKIYTEDKSGNKSQSAELLTESKIESGTNRNLKLLYYKLKPQFQEFKLVIEGKTLTGTPFIQFSQKEYKISDLTDKQQGLKIWNKIFKTFSDSKKPIPEDSKNKFLKQAFDE